MKKYLIGIDIGTSGTKTVLFDTEGATVASATFDYPLYQDKSAYAEQDAEDFYRAAAAGVRAVLNGRNKDEVAGVSLSGQMHGLVMLDGEGRVLRRCIIWCDQRTQGQAEQIEQLVGQKRLIEVTANPAVSGFTASKLLWVKQNQPEIYEKCKMVLLPKDYVRFRLTGELATEVSDASGTGLLNVRERSFSREICQKLDISFDLLPRVYESCEIAGQICAQAAKDTGLKAGTLVAAGAGDQAAAAVGNAIVEEGVVSDTLGSSGVVFAHTDMPLIDPLGRVHTFCHAVKDKWHIMGVTQGCGLSLKWLKNTFFKDITYKQIDEMASTVPAGSDGLLFLPYLMGERTPHLDANARGVFFGISGIHTSAHIMRSVIEGITFSQLDCLNIVRELGVTSSVVRVGGGGAASAFWRQMLADVFGCDIALTNSTEGGALGAAILAGVAAGVYPDVARGAKSIVKERQKLSPKGADYSKSYQLYKKLYTANKTLFRELGGL